MHPRWEGRRGAVLQVRLSWSCALPVLLTSSSVTLRAFGWLYEHHPRTAIANLSLLVAPVCVIKSQPTQLTHGYCKHLLNILHSLLSLPFTNLTFIPLRSCTFH